MKARIIIPTLPGHAKKNNRVYKVYLLKHNMLFRSKRPHKVEFNDDDSEIIWYFDGPGAHIMNVYRKLTQVDVATTLLLGTGVGAKTAEKVGTDEEKEQLENYKMRQVELDIIEE